MIKRQDGELLLTKEIYKKSKKRSEDTKVGKYFDGNSPLFLQWLDEYQRWVWCLMNLNGYAFQVVGYVEDDINLSMNLDKAREKCRAYYQFCDGALPDD